MSDTLARPKAPWAVRQVPPFPAIAQRILTLVSDEDVSTLQLGELIKRDPSFSAETLRLANSALFGCRREITSLSQAIVVVGMNRVKTMATVVAVSNMVRTSIRIESLRRIWSHSLATALITEEIARAARIDRESAYAAGLLHNLGALGLMSAYPIEYARMLDVSVEFGFDLISTEQDLFEIDHCAAGAYLARCWSFPDELAAVIATHHDEPVAGDRSVHNVTRVGWRLADSLGFAAFPSNREWSFEELAAFLPAAPGSWLTESAESARAELDRRITPG